ncbi:MAG: MCE family protein [Betaproteobacteria bacterium]|nr:MCE family protein [Betaproteobacteria bacterium]
MESRAHALAAGIFTLLLGLAVAASVFWFSGRREAMSEYVIVTKGNVSGLNTQAQVRFRGIRAGKVTDIELDPKDPRNILITISIDADLPVTKGTTARLNYQGVTGLASILIEDKGENAEPLTGTDDDLPRIALQPGFMDTLGENAAELMTQMRQVAERTTALLSDQNVKRIGQTLVNVESATAGLSNSTKELPQLMASLRQALSDENLKRLSATLANMEKVSGEAPPLIASLQGVAKKIDALLGESGGEIAQTTLPRLNALLQELAVNSRQMARLLDQIEESPNMLVFGRPASRPGPGEAGFTAQ